MERRVNMNRKIAFILSIMTVVMLSSCRAVSPDTPSQELSAHRWEAVKISGTLSFDDARMVFRASDGERKITLDGEYYADDEKLTLVTNDCNTIVFRYALKGDTLYLTYGGKTMELKKA